MDSNEEQVQELEALSEIYYDEIKVRSNKPPISFSIFVKPQASNYEEPSYENASDDDSDSDQEFDQAAEKQPMVELLFTMCPKYPETKPAIEVIDSQNLTDLELDMLLKNLNQKAEESLGTVMVFMLVSDVVEWLSNKAEHEINMLEQEKERKQAELEAEELRKSDGTLVTMETFLAWKAKFDAEMFKKKLEEQRKLAEQNPSAQKRLTGREMFETDKALVDSDLNFVDDLGADQIEALMQNIDEFELEENDDLEQGSDDSDGETDSDDDID